MNQKTYTWLEKHLLHTDHLPHSLMEVRHRLMVHTGRTRLTVGEEEACEHFWRRWYEEEK